MTLSTRVERRRRFARRALLSVTTILCSGLAAPAFAQLAAPAPMRQSIDANGVDLFAGTLDVDALGTSMGQGDQGLSYHQLNRGMGWTDSVTAALNQNGNTVTVSLGGTTDQFTVSGSSFAASQGNGATLTLGNNVYTYTRSDGTVVHFSRGRSSDLPYYASLGRVTDITQPSGTKLVYAYDSLTYCTRSKPGASGDVCVAHSTAYRINSVTSSFGYRLSFNYAAVDTSDSNNPDGFAGLTDWTNPIGVTDANLAQGGASSSETFGYAGSGGVVSYQVADPLQRVTSYRMNGNQIAGITRPGSGSEDVTVSYSGARISSVATPAGTWSYASSDAGSARTVTVTDPASQNTSYVFDIASSLMTKKTDALGHVSSWTYTPDGLGNVQTATAPEGNSVQYGYDARGNVTSTVLHAKPGAGQADTSTSAAYSASCANTLTCNKPTSTTDANNNTTAYTYDPTHGGVLTVTAPAVNGVNPQMRYGYTAFTDYLGGTVYRQTSSSTCRTQASCSGTADELLSSTGYGSLSANNLLPVSTTTRPGDGSVTVTTSVRYDAVGNVIASINAAGSETDSTFDADREPLAAISPDPDGSGPLNRRAVVLHYIPDGSVDSRSVGSTDASGTQFTPLQIAVYGYDAAHRLVRETDETDNSGNTVFAVTQYGFDEHGNPSCIAMRMNRAVFNSLPDACTASTQGSDGPDRITRVTSRDALNRVSEVTSAYGTGDASVERVNYTANGLVQNVRDAAGNRTSFEYDGFDRSYTTHYPISTAGQDTSDAGNFEQYGYDANGNLTSRRTRANQTFGYTYDALNRLTVKTVPSGMRSVFYAYDLLGRPTEARFDSPTGADAVLAGYDALGRPASSTTSMAGTSRTLSYQYDITDNRTQITHPDGVVFGTSYDLLGEIKNASWTVNGNTTPFMSITYDDLGRRTDINRGSSYTGTNFAGTPYIVNMDQRFKNGVGNAGLSFSHNAAGQITGQTRDNDDFAYTGASNANRAYAANGLNQYTNVNGATPGYDANGNLTSDGTNSYGYDAENQMVSASASNGTTLTYDPLGRLWQTASPVYGKTQFLYDGSQVAVEYDGDTGAMRRRYMFGPGIDEPILQDDGGALNCSGTKFLHTDQQGSVVALADCNGNRTAVNAYDEYGNPKPGNQGRFGYTGQAWLPDLGLWYYKARIYNPALGRFMQTDPIGYGDGLNWHTYAHGDPVNGSDPSGTDEDGPSLSDGVNSDGGDGGGDPPDIIVNGHPCSVADGCITINGDLSPQVRYGDNQTVTIPDLREGDIVVVAKTSHSDFFKTNVVPRDALKCTSGNVSFLAPPSFSVPGISNVGAAGGLPDAGRAGGQFGAFDFQRYRDSHGGTLFFSAYTDASNFATGVYLGGAGYGKLSASIISNGYAIFKSSNYGGKNQGTFRNAGIDAANGASVICKPAF